MNALNRIKKIVSVCAVLAIGFCSAVQAKAIHVNPEDEMLNLGIISERLDTSNTVTYAEYTTMILRAMGLENMIKTSAGENWYDAGINIASEMGFFEPFESEVSALSPIKTQYALCMAVSALGYYNVIGNNFDVLYSKAAALGLAGDMTAGDILTRENAYIIIQNALDSCMCVMDGRNYIISTRTLRDKLLDLDDSEYMMGIVEAVDDAAILGDFAKKGAVRIGGETFETDGLDMSKYLGSRVSFFVHTDARDVKTIKWVEPHRNNKVTELDENCDISIETNALSYYTEKGQKKNRIKLSDALLVIYNNRPTLRFLSDIANDSPRMKFTDNDGDGEYDIVQVTEIESCIVKNIYPNQRQIIFEYSTDGKKRLDTDDYKECAYFDENGNETDASNIKSGDVVSIAADENKEYIRLYKTDGVFEGVLTTKNGGDKEMTINSEVYKYIDGADRVSVGKNSTFCKDLWGRIFYSKEKFDDYVYIRRVCEGDVSDMLYLEVFDNENGFITYEISDDVNINGRKAQGVDNIVRSLGDNRVATIKKDSQGKISRIETAKIYASRGSRTYCENDFGFVDYDDKILQPFACDSGSTKVFFVPTTDKREDYFNMFALDDDDDYIVTGFDYDEDTNRVRAVVIEIDPDKPLWSGFSKSSKFMAVNQVASMMTSDNEVTYTVCGISDGQEITLAAAQKQNVFNELSGVEKGDVIQYVKNTNGDIGLVRKVMDFSELDKYYYDDTDYNQIELFASAQEINKEIMTNAKKYLVNEIKCTVNNSLVSSCVSASQKSVPDTDNNGFDNYFVYTDKKYESGNIDSIIPAYGEGDTGSDLYIWSKSDDVKFIAVINR